MLRKLVLHDVGPAAHLALDPVAPRLNLITGDNGLGKSFLLEAAWWALTRTWNGYPAVPGSAHAKLEHDFDGLNGTSGTLTYWDPKGQAWKRTAGKPANPGLVLYARVDGSFSVWDPLRNYRQYQRKDGSKGESPPAYQFNADEVLWGLRRPTMLGGREHEETLCLGLVDEWREWQRSNDPRFYLLTEILAHLGPDGEPLVPGVPVRPTIDDVRVIPTVRMRYGQDVPITLAPAGVQRMAKLAYTFAWALSSHLDEVERRNAGPGQRFVPAEQVIVLIDEPETHLHPRWQRTVLPSLIKAIGQQRGPWHPLVQFLVATHSPLVLASVEPLFDDQRDALWKLDLVEAANGGTPTVQIERDTAYRRGDANMWLLSDVFDETSPYSPAAEDVMAAASKLMGDPSADRAVADAVRKRMREVLADTDPFWLSWRSWMRSRGWTP